MSEDPKNFGGDPQFPPEFFAAGAETPRQELLRDDFARLTAINTNVLVNFDPQGIMSPIEEITLWSPLTEVQGAEPALAHLLHKQMLQGLGLEFTMLDADDPTLLFQYKYDDHIVQIKRILRTDGTSVVVCTNAKLDHTPLKITLMNEDHAAENVARRKSEVERAKLISALITRLKIGDAEVAEFRESARGMDLADLRAMHLGLLKPETTTGDAEFDRQIKGMETASRQQSIEMETAVIAARKRYAQAVMPLLGFLDSRQKKAEERAAEYEELLNQKMHAEEYTNQLTGYELRREQARRHVQLNARMRRRKIIKGASVTALVGIVDAVAIAATTAAGRLGELNLDTKTGAALGVLIGAVITGQEFISTRRSLRYAVRFTPENTAGPGQPLAKQLRAEIQRGQANATNIRNAGR